jgi:hypothetical protein
LMFISRYWTPGRIGNLYSPNPGEDSGAVNMGTQRLRGQERTSSGWSWRRLPWSRGSSTNAGPIPDHSHRYRLNQFMKAWSPVFLYSETIYHLKDDSVNEITMTVF